MAQGFENSVDAANSNFNSATAGQTNKYFLPAIYSKKVQNAFRKSSVVEAITNTDYQGEISAFGDSVRIVKEPTIAVFAYSRGLSTASGEEQLSDQETQLIVDKANAFQFKVDDIEKSMSHVNWKEVAASSAAYSLKDAFDVDVLSTMLAGVSTSAPDNLIGADAAAGTAGLNETAASVDLTGSDGTGVDALDLLARLARKLDDQNIPEEGRFVTAGPDFYEELSRTDSKLMSVDYNGGQGSVRNGLVSSGMLRGFSMYKTNNMPNGSTANVVIGGHISATSTAQTILKTETIRDNDSFGDICRGLHVYGSKVLRPEALTAAYYVID